MWKSCNFPHKGEIKDTEYNYDINMNYPIKLYKIMLI